MSYIIYLYLFFLYFYTDEGAKAAPQDNGVVCPRSCRSYVNEFGIRVQVSDSREGAAFILLQLRPALAPPASALMSGRGENPS